MAANTKKLVKRIIERNANGKLVFNHGLFEAQRFGPRKLVAVVEGTTYNEAVAMFGGERTKGGHSYKGFKKIKTKDDA